MKWTQWLAAAGGVAAVAALQVVYTPGTVLAIAVKLALGVVAHELVHYGLAAVFAREVRLVWAGRPEVRYQTPHTAVARLVNLAPFALGVAGVISVISIANIPPSPVMADTLAFCIGLMGYSREDFSLRVATAPAHS